MAGTVRGFIALDRGDPRTAELDARSVLAMVSPYGVLDPARVGPRALLASARLAQGDTEAAVRMLAPLAATPHAPSMLYPRRQLLAVYATALLESGRPQEALAASELGETLPAVDVRSLVRSALAHARTLDAVGRCAEADAALARAAELADGTQQSSERPAVMATRGLLRSGVGDTV
jgi:hypothetical protein